MSAPVLVLSALAGRRIAVTGATGFIGRALLRAVSERGARPVAVVRSPEKLGAVDLEARRADLADVDALTAAFDGCDAIVANAGLVSIGRQSREALTRANVEGTRNVLEAARRAGVRRIVMTSSATVYARRAGRVYEEDDALWAEDARVARPRFLAGGKAAPARGGGGGGERHGLELSVARPSGVYGEHDHSGLTPWLDRLARVPLVTVFPAYMRVPMTYVGDLADAMLRMLERPIAAGRAYNVVGDPDVSFWQLFAAYREARGISRQLVVPIPVPIRYAYSLERARRELDYVNRSALAVFTAMLSAG